MLVTHQPVLKKFWYPVMPMSHLETGPKPFTLLGYSIVLWKDANGAPAAVIDRCSHRTAKLSKGWVSDGDVVCPYHGWAYNRTGACTRVPQVGDTTYPDGIAVAAYQCQAKYDHAWVCLDEPLAPIPEFEEEVDPQFRKIHEFYEVWRCAGLRVMENSFDNAHFSFVHQKSFGRIAHPEPSSLTLTEIEGGFLMHTVVPVKNPDIQKKVLQMEEGETVRNMNSRWWLPFVRKLKIAYPNGLIHSIVTAATPIDDRNSHIVQFAYRSDTEEQAAAKDIIAFDRQVTNEDREILESTDFDVSVDLSRRIEEHMAVDRPGLVMRKQLMKLFNEHGETDVVLN